MRRKDERLRGIYDKNVFFVKRYMSPEFGSHFTLTTKKEICNDYERFNFYLKVGGIAFLDKVSVPGQWLREAREKLRECNHFGSYLFYSTTNKKLRVVIYAKKTLYTIGDIMLSRSSLVHSVIPRYDGERYDGQMIKGMKLDLSSNRSRKWEKYDSNEDVEQHDGLHYIYESFDLTELKQDRTIEWGRQYKGQTGIYVPKNTTLLLQDGGRAYAHLDYHRFVVWTVCQEGAFIAIQQDFRYVFYDENDGEEYDSYLIYREKKDRFDCPNFDHFEDNNKSRVLFLKPAPEFTAWTLRMCRVRRWDCGFEAQLCVPSGGRLETVMDWEDGIREVKRRQVKKPWLKYIEPFENLSVSESLSELDLENAEAYPNQNQIE